MIATAYGNKEITRRSMILTRRIFTDWFDRTYVIHLMERTDRLGSILEQFAKVGVCPEPGRVEIFPAFKPESADGFPNCGARGCFQSHREALARAMEDNLHRVLMIEDDLEMDQALLGLPGSLLDQLDQAEWGIAYLGHNLPMPPLDPPQFVITRGEPIGSHFYAIQGEAIPKLIAYLDSMLTRQPGDPLGSPMDYDGALTMFRRFHPEVRTVAATTSLGRQGASRSDVRPRPWDRYPLVRDLAMLARGVRALAKK
jgi:glycosyl transferase family 25